MWTLVGKRAYIVTYMAIENDFDRNFGIVKSMVRSFKVK